MNRSQEIFQDFLKEIDIHLQEIEAGTQVEMYHIKDLAARLYIHPTHLSNVIKMETGHAPCYFFEDKLVKIAKEMLATSDLSVAQIAYRLTFDPSNFNKFFKRFVGVTPAVWRQQRAAESLTTSAAALPI